jgi:hypothetical protein
MVNSRNGPSGKMFVQKLVAWRNPASVRRACVQEGKRPWLIVGPSKSERRAGGGN